MEITFSVPREINGTKYQPDDTADLPDDVAKTLLHDGHARRAEPAPESDAELPQPPPKSGSGSGLQAWVDYASAHGVAVSEDAKREDIWGALTDAGVPTDPPAQPSIEPDPGNNGTE